MGTWSYQPFGNDEAEELLGALNGEDGFDVLRSTLMDISLRELDDEDECQRAVAACEVVAAAAGYPVTGLPAAVRAWLKTGEFRLTATLHKRAQRVASAILKSSGLAAVWNESGNAKRWQRSMESLVGRLEKPVKATPASKTTRASKTGPASAVKRTSGQRRSTEKESEQRQSAGAAAPRDSRRSASAVVSPKAPPASTTAVNQGSVKPISLREVAGLLKKKLGGGHAGTVHGNKQLHEISFGTAKRIPGIRDAERMATLPNVDSFTVGGQRYSAEQVRSLQILITGWSTLRELTATGTSGGLAGWICRHAPSMSHLEVLELDYSDVTDADLKELRGCSQLREVGLSSTQITTKGLESLKAIRSLKRVSVCHCDQISVAAASRFITKNENAFELAFLKHDDELGITPLASDARTQYLKQNGRVQAAFDKSKNAWPNRFFGTTFVVAAVPPVVPLSEIAAECRLESLVIGSEWTGEAKDLSTDDMRMLLRAWPDLRELRVGKIAECESAMIETLGGLKQLRKLQLHETPCGDAILPVIGTLKNLVYLELHHTSITGAALHHLEKLPQLRWVSLEKNNDVSDADAQALRRRLAGKTWVDLL